jgi:acetoin utilization deacetylase AcuC-like enzyme
VKAWYTDRFDLPLPAGHRFPIAKYHRLRERVEADGRFLLLVPDAAQDDELLLAHEGGYLQRVILGALDPREVRALGFPWSPQLVERSRRSVGATIAACRAALSDGAGASLAGGTHHAFADRPQGYCLFNDSAVAARVMRREGLARRVLVIDTDVHQGNGTAAIGAGDEGLFTFSIHGQGNFPAHKETSDLDIALPDGTGDDAYLDALDAGLRSAFARARADLVIHLAGADAYAGDRLGRLALSRAGLAERDRRVVDACRTRGLPMAVTMGGGYANDIDDIVDIHFHSLATAATLAGAVPIATASIP